MKKDSYKKVISKAIAETILPLMELEIVVKKTDVTKRTVKNHSDELLSEFANYCAYETVKEAVNRFFRDNMENGNTSKELNNQMEFKGEGFDRVQKYYSIERSGELCAVSVNMLTEVEVDIIIEQLNKNAKGLVEHARQLKLFYAQKVRSE